jgi:hypothetical protein
VDPNVIQAPGDLDLVLGAEIDVFPLGSVS